MHRILGYINSDFDDAYFPVRLIQTWHIFRDALQAGSTTPQYNYAISPNNVQNMSSAVWSVVCICYLS